jgi:GNAT superfamily N-acetyltransferase
MHAGSWELRRAREGELLDAFRELATEYVRSLPFDLDFQDFEGEMEHLPGDYGPPRGLIVIAVWQGNRAGCVALRPLDPETCEMKRLYVRAEFRGHGLGKALAERAVEEARRMAYARMRLDTVASMKEANAMYQRMGFREIPAYRLNPRPDARFFELAL